ncbi:MAG: ATP-dependent DNA ligase [Pseudomonadota bacterium]
MQLERLVETWSALAATRRRLTKQALLADLLTVAVPADRSILLHYVCGQLPQGKVGIGPALIHSLRRNTVASEATLTLDDVDAAITAFAAIEGKGARARRIDTLDQLYARASVAEHAFLDALLLGELRQGALDGVLVEAVAAVSAVPSATVRRAAMLAGSLVEAAIVAFDAGGDGLAQFRLTPGRALAPMLAQPADSVAAAFASISDPIVDAKLDGARVQIHRDGDTVRIFTRQLHDVTRSVPDIVAAVKALPVTATILDGEVLIVDKAGRPKPFQETMRRFSRRAPNASEQRERPLSLFVFDCLLYNDAALIDQPLSERLRIAASFLPAGLIIPRCWPADVDAAQAFLDDVLDKGHEGVMVKAAASVYAAGNRGADWLKVKPVHTLDLVVLAVEWGSGRRRGLLSNLHLGCRDEVSGEFVMLGKTFKGLTDKMLRWQTDALLALECERDEYRVVVRPELVVEVAFSDVLASSQYPGGVALRFARVRRHRPDKNVNEIDTLATVRELHGRRQTG